MSVSQSTNTAPDWAVGYVYLLETNDRFQKIGFSQAPAQRNKKFSGLPFAVWVGHQFPVGDMRIELAIHLRFKDRRVRGEWFCLDPVSIGRLKAVAGAKASTAGSTASAVAACSGTSSHNNQRSPAGSRRSLNCNCSPRPTSKICTPSPLASTRQDRLRPAFCTRP